MLIVHVVAPFGEVLDIPKLTPRRVDWQMYHITSLLIRRCHHRQSSSRVDRSVPIARVYWGRISALVEHMARDRRRIVEIG